MPVTATLPSEHALSSSTLDVLPRIRQACADMPVIKQLYLFGSRARGTDMPYSDFDFFAVLDFDHPTLVSSYLNVIEQLETIVRKPVDLVVDGYWSYRDEILKSEIERDKVLIYDCNAQ